VFTNLLWELGDEIARRFEICRRIIPTSTMAVFVLPKWAKLNELTRRWNSYHEFHSKTQQLTCPLKDDSTKQEVVASPPWLIHLWLINADCEFYDFTLTTYPLVPDEPPSVHVPVYEPTKFTGSSYFPGRVRHVVEPHRSSLADSIRAKRENS
jgi:hypothetical protein